MSKPDKHATFYEPEIGVTIPVGMAKPRTMPFGGYIQASNAGCYALGSKLANGRFSVRRIVWGIPMAKAEKRDGEKIRRAAIFLKPEPVKAKKKRRAR